MEYRSRRHPAIGRISLRTKDGTEMPGDLLDASEDGAKVQVVGELAVGDCLQLCATRMAFWAYIRWTHDGEAGLQFAQPITRGELEELVGKPFARNRTNTGRWMYGD